MKSEIEKEMWELLRKDLYVTYYSSSDELTNMDVFIGRIKSFMKMFESYNETALKRKVLELEEKIMLLNSVLNQAF